MHPERLSAEAPDHAPIAVERRPPKILALFRAVTSCILGQSNPKWIRRQNFISRIVDLPSSWMWTFMHGKMRKPPELYFEDCGFAFQLELYIHAWEDAEAARTNRISEANGGFEHQTPLTYGEKEGGNTEMG
jgi:hypothetical protein